ncbi:NAD-dependent epimerase/dehydratase family protein [Nocardioides cheoyonin]|uniref:NAD-dependent epimerase/dehydratase family protein n=1 Tax=Nocardioides cheoyonin TaxID=3156615 RepID=UPI0032B5CD5B
MTVLVVGASGLIGTAAVERFLADGQEVVALSRRPPALGPDVDDAAVRHVPLDLRDAEACADAVRRLPAVERLVFAAVHETPGLVAGWKDAAQMETNLAMLGNVLEPVAARGSLKHVSLMQGTKAYGVLHHRVPVPARESHPRDRQANFYWLQEDHVRAAATRHGFHWTILRPPLVVGPNHGVAMNLVPVIGAYAAIRAELGLGLGYPGGPGYVTEAVDVRLLADALLWASSAPEAADEIFNVSNGEVFSWPDLWPAIVAALGAEAAAPEPVRLAEWLPAQEEVWRRVLQRHRLRPLALAELLGESHHYADFHFATGARRPLDPVVASTVKIHRAGFTGVMNTEETFAHWLGTLAERGVLPPLT